MRLFFISLVIVLDFKMSYSVDADAGVAYQTAPVVGRYFAYPFFIAYAAIYFWKGDFVFKTFERVIFLLGEAVALVMFSLFLGDLAHLIKYELDFVAIVIIIFLDVVVYSVRLVAWIWLGKRFGDQTAL
jgi:hypothetical protein